MKSAASRLMRRGIVCLLAVLFVLLSASCRSTRGLARDSREGPRPIAVLLDTSVWDLGQATPSLVVYENGQVVLTEWGNEGIQLRSFSLSAAELDALRRQVHELAVLKPLRSYKALEDHCMVMDTSYSNIYVRDGRHEASVSVYALEHLLRDRDLKSKPRPYEKGGPPPQFISLYYRLKALAETQPPLAQSWNPIQVEVRLRDDFKHRYSQSVPWPKDWSAPNSPRAKAHGDHAWYVLLDGAKLPQLRRLLPFNHNETAVLIDGKIWAACWRPILPGETMWWNDFTSSRR